MIPQVGDLVVFYHYAKNERFLCLVTHVDKWADGKQGYLCFEWFSEYAKNNFTPHLPSSTYISDKKGYWSKLS